MNMIYRLHNQPNLRGVSFSDQVAQAQAAVKNIDTELLAYDHHHDDEEEESEDGGGSGDEDCRHGCDCCNCDYEGKDVFAAIAVKEKYCPSGQEQQCDCSNFDCNQC